MCIKTKDLNLELFKVDFYKSNNLNIYFLILLFLVSFQFLAQENKIASVDFKGNKKTKSNFLIDYIDTQVSDAFSITNLENDLTKLKRLPAIANASYKYEKTPNGYTVYYEVEENLTTIPGANVFTTDNDEFAYKLSLYEFNLLGKNITIGGFFQRDIFNAYGLEFRAPCLINKNLGISLNFRDWTTQEPVFLENGEAQYKYNNTSFDASILYQFTLKHRIEIGGGIFNEAYEYISGTQAAFIPNKFNVDKFQLVGLYDFNNLEYEFHYVSGFRNILNVQYINSSNAILPSFVIGWNDLLYFKRFGKKGNWASRLRLGLATNDDSPFAPFAVDNNLNVRGVGNTIDRGTGVALLNTEYRQTIYEKNWFVVQSNVFVDIGTWRQPQGELDDFVDKKNFRVYPGVGLRFLHKKIYNAVFRIDYGYGVLENVSRGFVFGIGQYF